MTLQQARKIRNEGWVESKYDTHKEFYEIYKESKMVLQKFSFNGKLLREGDEVIALFGTNLRNSVIESINPVNFSVKLKGIKRTFASKDLIIE